MKKTKIICTIGPKSANEKTLTEMIKHGMNVARINMSHGDYESLQNYINLIKQVRTDLDVPVAIMIDTKGPEIRLGNFPKSGVELKVGQKFTLTKKSLMGTNEIASISYKPMIDEVNIGDKIYANNGMLVLKVTNKGEDFVETKVLFGGKLTTHKGVNVPTVKIRSNYLSAQDKEDILFAIKNNVEYIAASFVSSTNDVKCLKKFIEDNGGENISIISKIENAEGVKNVEQIAKISEGIMIARGDLGVEIPLEKIPNIQKKIIKLCNNLGKISVVATEMLESMTYSIRPTRAEVSDVAGAIYEQATATMLSGETAVGMHPAKVVKTMSKIIIETEKHIAYNNLFNSENFKTLSVSDSVANSTCKNATSLNAACSCIYTKSGTTAQLASRYRTNNKIVALTSDKKTYQSLSLCWNTHPVLTKTYSREYEMIENAKLICKKLHFAKTNDIIVMVVGTPKESGTTNTLKILNV